ncbi:MAG: hypothetical protein ABR502_06460 [Chitinophagaceae bacterium]
MKLLFILTAVILSASCNNSSNTAKAFCDTTCTSDSFKFSDAHKLNPYVIISVQNCNADTLTWSHDDLPTQRQVHVGTFLEKQVRLHKSAINCFIKDTSYAWLSFNDCITGRGYLMKLPFSKKESINKMSSALNSFDKKFAVPDDLRAYADYSTIYVVDVNTGNKEQMSFKEELDIDFDSVHDVIDSVNIGRNRIYASLIKNGKKVPMEKVISL